MLYYVTFFQNLKEKRKKARHRMQVLQFFFPFICAELLHLKYCHLSLAIDIEECWKYMDWVNFEYKRLKVVACFSSL